ncbi:MAG TPA: DUF6785 family protein [Chthonomonadaceae bacterium]|nr:DUF6785 family protein [Chthonomonadaceae bacterium]
MKGGVTARAVVLGLLMSAVIVGLTQAMSIERSAAEVGGGAPAPAPTYLLFFYVLLVAPLLGRLLPGKALTRGELLLVYALMLVAGPITHPYAIGFLIPHTVSPRYYNANEPDWSIFQGALPRWMGPTDASAVTTFFQGGSSGTPWAAWAVPLIAWGSLLIALFTVMLCINVLMRRQWAENERLTFPLAAIPLALTGGEPSGASVLSRPYLLVKQPIFWAGLALPLLLQAPYMLHQYLPQLPDLPLRELTLVDGRTLAAPWNGIGRLELHLIFWLIGVAYLLPKEVTLSAWTFYFIRVLENVAAVWLGRSGEPPSVYTNEFPALFAQGAGAAFALAAITLWMARRHLAAAFGRAFRGASEPDDRGEFLSYRTAIVGAIGGSAFVIGWLCLAGMRLPLAALLFAMMLAYFFIFARIRAEAGLGMDVILWPKMLDEVMITVVGAQNMRLSELTALYAVRWLYFGSATGSVMACQLEGLKLADAGGLSGRRVGRALALGTAATVILALVWTLATYYRHGFESLPIGQRSTSMVGSQIYYSFQDLVHARNTASGPDWRGIAAMGAGALITVALAGLRARFLWFPLHPVGYLAANCWGIHINWLAFFLGWLINALISRYGGLALYRKLLPLFIGLVIGDMLHEGLWGLVRLAAGTTA